MTKLPPDRVMAFLGADLVAATVVWVHIKYYGWGYALYLSALLYVCMVAAGVTVHLFAAVGSSSRGMRRGRLRPSTPERADGGLRRAPQRFAAVSGCAREHCVGSDGGLLPERAPLAGVQSATGGRGLAGALCSISISRSP